MAATQTVEVTPRHRTGHARPGSRGVLRWLGPMGPALLMLLLFVAGPILWCFYSAFTNTALTGTGAGNVQFVGLANFQRMLADPQLVPSIILTIVFVVGSAIVGQNLLGLLIATLMQNRGRVIRAIVGTVVLGAWVLPEIVAAFIWYAFLNPEGTLNMVFKGMGLPAQNWLYTTPMLAVILANIWRGTAFSMLVYSAALSEVPPEVQESAEVDGASVFQRFWYITLPLVRRQIMTNLMLITLQTLSVFTLIFAMTAGGPGTKSQTLPLLMYQQAFKFSDLAYGMAIAFVLLAVGGIFSAIYMRVLKPEI
ncbi:carbohydrate ABC transporter permease [Fodinicola acaciae]|uniref:carbohydrate ABC transporter permease n=1 Tax=Fodinicola acaciae TaxID=2681555 RepID=UPI0013D173E2|nr:sugar ABC transporter permease [Fodinicola acaciae]